MAIAADDPGQMFPSLGSDEVYLDSAAKTLTCQPSLDSMSEYYSKCDVNVDRGIYQRSIDASIALEDARSAVAKMIRVQPERLVFSSSTTSAINTIAGGICWRRGDRVVTTALEHHSNFLPWLKLREAGVDVVVVPSDPEGYIDPDQFEASLAGARLAAFTHASNAIGTLQDITALTLIARQAGALVLIDGAQGVSHGDPDIGGLDPDAYAFSGHKCFGPTGTGALYLSERMLNVLEPSVLGGGSASDSSAEGFTLREEPVTARYEPGTPNIAGILGFGAAAHYRASLDWKNLTGEVSRLLGLLLEGLDATPGVVVFGGRDLSRRTPVVSFGLKGYTPHQLGTLLGCRYGIMVRSGHHCAPTLWKTLYGRPEGAVRASLHVYNSVGDVDRLLNALNSMGMPR